MWRQILAIGFGMLCQTASAQSGGVNVLVTEVSDNRTTGQFFAGAEIKLSLVGDILADVRGVRKIQLTKAVDDTGRNLLKQEEVQTTSPFSFEPNERKAGPIQKSLKFINPSRQASMIKEVSGTIELYAPGKDRKSVVMLKDLMRETGKPLAMPELVKSKVSLTILTKDQFEAIKKDRQASREKTSAGGNACGNVGEALADAFKQMFSGFMRMDDNDLAFLIKDPDNNLVDLEVQDEKGAPLKRSGRMSSGNTYTISFNEKPGPNTRVAIFLATPASIIKVPLALKDIALP